MIRKIEEKQEKMAIARAILEALTDWFGVPEAREQYTRETADWLMFADMEDGQPVGFLCLKETGKATMELALMGVLQPYHRQGIGRRLFAAARETAREMGYHFMQVKTVQMGHYEDYDRTNLFYRSLGFEEFEVFPTYWDEANPCQIYVMALT